MSDEDALFVFHIAPLSVRRYIAMLGVIHRTVLGRGPFQFRELFKLAPLDGHPARTRSQCSQHRFQLEDSRDQHHSDMLARSALGLVWVYNLLPPKIVEQPSASRFQAELQRLVKDRARARCADWAQSLSLARLSPATLCYATGDRACLPLSQNSAPQTVEPSGATADSGPRLRHRGPRSEHVRSRRALAWAPPPPFRGRTFI